MDRLSISWSLGAGKFDPDPASWDAAELQHVGPDGEAEVMRLRALKDVRGASCFVGVSHRKGQPPVAKLELNPSRVGDPDGWQVAPVEAVAPAVRQALVAVGELVSPPGELAAARVRRVDGTRDFGGVERPSDFLQAQATLRRPWARLNLVHSDPGRSGAQTLMVGSRSGGVVRAYDKHAEKPCAPDGTVRFEVEARGPWAQNYGGIRAFGDLTGDNVLALVKDRWNWAQLGAEVSAMQTAMDSILRLDSLTNTQKRGLVGFLVMQASGAGEMCSDRQAKTYRKWQRELGIVLEDFDVGASRHSQRLDWDTGLAVVA